MRVIAGTYKSRILKSLKGLACVHQRPPARDTFQRAGPNIAGSRFVDSSPEPRHRHRSPQPRRREVIFIENHVPAATLIRRNLESLASTPA